LKTGTRKPLNQGKVFAARWLSAIPIIREVMTATNDEFPECAVQATEDVVSFVVGRRRESMLTYRADRAGKTVMLLSNVKGCPNELAVSIDDASSQQDIGRRLGDFLAAALP
jgi:hypothetical protein